ncbi:MAG: hypothetical protein J6A92_00190 [Lachnospiraceae bacterium]|nr:hypothetical protein [Lachnospiraceae bacterium]
MENEGEMILAALEGLSSKFDDMDLKFELLDTKFEGLDNKYEASDSRFEMFDDKFETLHTGIESISSRFEQLEQKTDTVNEVCLAMHTTVENEMNNSMQTMAEAFTDMKCKLDEAMKVKAENEILRMRIEQLENDMRKIKEHLGIL